MERKNYIVDMPKKIIFGDPMYFEDYADDTKKLNSLICNLKIKDELKARMKCVVSLIEEDKMVEMRIGIAPEENISVYLNEMKYNTQKHKVKDIGVDSASYLIQVDNQEDEFYTGGDGYWGSEETFYRTISGKKFIDAYLVNIILPENIESIKDAESYVNYFFKNKKEYKLAKIN